MRGPCDSSTPPNDRCYHGKHSADFKTPVSWRVYQIRDSIAAIAPGGGGRVWLWYQVDWTGWPRDPDFYDTAWYPAANFKNCPAKLQEFHNTYPNKPGPPLRLAHWHQAFMRGILPAAHDDDNSPALRTFPRPQPLPAAIPATEATSASASAPAWTPAPRGTRGGPPPPAPKRIGGGGMFAALDDDADA